MIKLWEGQTQALHRELDADNQLMGSFDSQYVGKVKGF